MRTSDEDGFIRTVNEGKVDTGSVGDRSLFLLFSLLRSCFSIFTFSTRFFPPLFLLLVLYRSTLSFFFFPSPFLPVLSLPPYSSLLSSFFPISILLLFPFSSFLLPSPLSFSILGPVTLYPLSLFFRCWTLLSSSGTPGPATRRAITWCWRMTCSVPNISSLPSRTLWHFIRDITGSPSRSLLCSF